MAAAEAAAGAARRRRVEASFRRVWKAKRDCGLIEDRGLAPEKFKIIGCASHRAMAEKMARASLAWARKAKRPLTGPVAYCELGASSPQDWQGRPFVKALRAVGILAKPYSPQSRLPAIVASFSTPKAFLGKIRSTDRELRQAQSAIAEAPSAIVVSFGSPFVMDHLKNYTAGLCAFSSIEASQKAAALALAGKIKATGRMPVALKSQTH